MARAFFLQNKITKSKLFLLTAGTSLIFGFSTNLMAQDLPLDEPLPTETEEALPLPTDTNAEPEAEVFNFDDSGIEFEQSAEDLEESFRAEAFDQALKKLLPLRPEEIRTLLEHYDRTIESTQLPVHPYPRPESAVQNISLDPGSKPLVVKMAKGYVTTLSILDASGQPWPIADMSWVGDFAIQQSTVDNQTHMLRISSDSEFAHGNISMRLLGLNAPVIMTLETSRDLVHYRFDAIVPMRGPGAPTPLIDPGISLAAGDTDMSIALSGVMPNGAEALDVGGVDGRTTAFNFNGLTYLRTPLTLLSPGWESSVTSADGTKVYALEETPVVLLSDRGRMVRAFLSEREELLDE
ncbi:MAG: type IV secretion protein DotH [Alphaproteobacteria bacterium]|nr:type IV secretion protein DotH [Alphaproteobacteria bacterium]